MSETTLPESVNSVLATDCGSTTTKAILIERVGDEYRLVVRGEAPTTVEAPFEDVTRGVLNAVREVEELANRKLLDGEKIISPQNGNEGVDIYISTSSAGGGLQMMVTGVVKSMTGESAERAALGAGAIVMDVIASNDGRLPHEKIQRIRQLRPDMILLSGGVDGGTTRHVVELGEMLAAADPKARLGSSYQLPVIYSGNEDAREDIRGILGKKTSLTITDNLRPTMEVENLMPARLAIHDLFMEHVMAQAPGYKKLMSWSPVPIMPTPAAVGNIIEAISKQENIDVLGVDIGGATTDVFSVFSEVFNRTVSANLGMSYSISNVLAEAKIENVMRWIPVEIDETDLRNRIKNKMIRPTTIPQTLEELMIEQAMCREALRLAMDQHRSLAVGLKGVQQVRTISDTFEQSTSGETLVNMETLSLVVGSGGVLSHAPRRQQAMILMTDAFQPEGITEMAVDSIFMMPQLGVLSTKYPEVATEVFEKDCLIRLGTVVAPWGEAKPGQAVLKARISMPDGNTVTHSLGMGDLVLIPLEGGQTASAVLEPAKTMDLGSGRGRPVERVLKGGVAGILLDARGRRPFVIPGNKSDRVQMLQRWNEAVNMYPQEIRETVSA